MVAIAGVLCALSSSGCAAGDSSGSTVGGAGGAAPDGGSDASGGGGHGGATQCEKASDCIALDSACATGACESGSCVSKPKNELGSCDDGLWCTENDTCQSGACVGGTERFCPSSDSCHVGVCDEDADTCKNVEGNDGGQCDDMDPCTKTGLCIAGVCTKGSAVDCSVFDGTCTKGVCDQATGCKSVPANEGGPCDDGKFCNVNEACQAGVCSGGVPRDCPPPGGCFVPVCDESADVCGAMPGNDGDPCDDGSPCTGATTCLAGACVGGVPANDGTACNDGNACTVGEFCNNGACGGGSGPVVFFADDFSDNAQGWILGTEWQIGPAQASGGGAFGADPASDHTNTGDNGVAGVVLGGNASTAPHGFSYLESPPFDASGATGPVILGFRRWLNSDAHPGMHDTIDVWNGSAWINIWSSGFSWIEDSPPNGLGWTFVQHDLTNYKNAQMRIRFGFDVQLGALSVGSWNIDDVLVAAAACP